MSRVSGLRRVRGGVVEPATALVVPCSEGRENKIPCERECEGKSKWNCAKICWHMVRGVPMSNT